jgi:hypothetical protein
MRLAVTADRYVPAESAVAPLEIRAVATGLVPLVPAHTIRGALKGPWVLQPVYADFSILSPTWLWIAMPALALLVLAGLLLLSRGRALRVRRVPAWRSATGGVEGDAWYTSHGYANPTRRILAGVLRARSTVTTVPDEAAPPFEGGPRTAPRYRYSSDIVEIVETHLYQPLLRPLRAVAAGAKRLQSGHLDAYLGYLLLALLTVVTLVVALG